MTNPACLLEENLSNSIFSDAVSSFKFGKTFKTTTPNRHYNTDNFILDYCHPSFNFLDVGASTGITSLELMHKLDFKFNKFYVTDFNLSVELVNNNGSQYFFNDNGECILIANKSYIVYPQESSLLAKIKNKGVEKARALDKEKILLINPDLKEKIDELEYIHLKRYNVMSQWDGESLNIIKAANLFNRSYFSDQEILDGIRNLYDVLRDEGLLVIIDNREIEKSSIFQKNSSSLTSINTINGGTEIHSLIESNF